MAKHLNRLTARSAATLKKPGRHGDGGNLNLAISRTCIQAVDIFVYFAGHRRAAGGRFRFRIGGVARAGALGRR